jgi:hypothetical protein
MRHSLSATSMSANTRDSLHTAGGPRHAASWIRMASNIGSRAANPPTILSLLYFGSSGRTNDATPSEGWMSAQLSFVGVRDCPRAHGRIGTRNIRRSGAPSELQLSPLRHDRRPHRGCQCKRTIGWIASQSTGTVGHPAPAPPAIVWRRQFATGDAVGQRDRRDMLRFGNHGSGCDRRNSLWSRWEIV